MDYINNADFEIEEIFFFKNLKKFLLSEIERNNNEHTELTEADFKEFINVCNEKIKKVTDRDIVFLKVAEVIDNRKTIKKETDKIIGYTTVCQDVSVEIYEEIDVENPDYNKKFYFIDFKAKTKFHKNYRKFFV